MADSSLRVRGIQHLNLTVRDLARARAFYVDTLGFRETFAKGETIWLDAGGDLLGLSRGEPSVSDGFGHFGFRVDSGAEVDAWVAQLRANGAPIEKGPYDRSDGRSVYFRDPDGHLLEIFWVDPVYLSRG